MQITAEAVRRLQKDGEYRFRGVSRKESKTLAQALIKAAREEDRRWGTEGFEYKIALDAFGYYKAKQI